MKWKDYGRGQKIYQIVMHLFALTGIAITGAWLLYKLGVSNNAGGVDKNNRYLAEYSARPSSDAAEDSAFFDAESHLRLAVLGCFYPYNARLIRDAASRCDDPEALRRMLYAAGMYLHGDSVPTVYETLVKDMERLLAQSGCQRAEGHLIPWMNESNWEKLKDALVRDTAAIRRAAALTGVDARLIAGCTVGEQVRLFQTARKREYLKQHLGPVALTVQSQFSLGVNGIKEPTAIKVERNLRDTASLFYMGEAYAHLLDYPDSLDEPALQELRMARFLNERDHFYSYLYTACILKQTMWQWKRSGYDISNRPDILFTLFNLGFGVSRPHPDPQCGGSIIEVNGRRYTFGLIGNDFFYSGELNREFPIESRLFYEITEPKTAL
ncbi:MAG: hypothetical protein J5873_04375 [Bacteroidales bacterium]|nr:hypothetical protein [Bacteroidales bacterium]